MPAKRFTRPCRLSVTSARLTTATCTGQLARAAHCRAGAPPNPGSQTRRDRHRDTAVTRCARAFDASEARDKSFQTQSWVRSASLIHSVFREGAGCQQFVGDRPWEALDLHCPCADGIGLDVGWEQPPVWRNLYLRLTTANRGMRISLQAGLQCTGDPHGPHPAAQRPMEFADYCGTLPASFSRRPRHLGDRRMAVVLKRRRRGDPHDPAAFDHGINI